ncbi:glycosyltransferase [Priestia megaterium]|uniref:glycosyltransferase n=1 Tax=Priestia megaterium TaxID=1404 RepID=UPI0024532108|nr:glycosyltransferase [Priestia megaterium]MDH3181641.1 glycosyltransferase [Priestia megaterium]
MKKKIVFMIINMNVGGTEKALLNMISEIPKDKYDITILMLEKYGGFLNSIPHEVHVKYLKGYEDIKDMLNSPPHITAINLFKKGNAIKALNISAVYLASKVTKNKSIFFKYILRKYPKLKSEYDIAVAYAGPMDFISYFVVNKIKAKKKIQWIHFDITKIGFDKHFASKLYKKFNRIFVVSNEGRNKLINVLPVLKERVEVFSNIISLKLIHDQAKENNGFNDSFDGIRILTVGRLTSEKGQDLAIRALARLKDDGYKVKWYCLGEGRARKTYEKLIEEYNLQGEFILLGTDSNPYPYIDQCNLYVQPSRHEGYCITLAEARCLEKPIITTDFTGAKEQIKNEETGLIVKVDEKEIYTAVKKLINNNHLCNEFSENLKKESFENTFEMKKIYNLS